MAQVLGDAVCVAVSNWVTVGIEALTDWWWSTASAAAAAACGRSAPGWLLVDLVVDEFCDKGLHLSDCDGTVGAFGCRCCTGGQVSGSACFGRWCSAAMEHGRKLGRAHFVVGLGEIGLVEGLVGKFFRNDIMFPIS